MIRSRRLAGTLLVLYVLAAAVIVLSPSSELPSDAARAIWRVLRDLGAPSWVDKDAVEVVTNVLLFVPLSYLGATFRPHWGWWHWLVAGFAVTFVVELVQAVFLPDRTPDPVDMVANTVGALVGYWLSLIERPARRRRRGR